MIITCYWYNRGMIERYVSPIGELILVAENGALVEIGLDGVEVSKVDENDEDGKVLREVREWLDGYFGGRRMTIDNLKLAPEGTEFQKEVWEILREIPYGETMSYGEIAQGMAEKRGMKKMSAQAVGQAVGKNPIPIIVPCHRVIGKDGRLTGYSGGMEKKIWLLEHEGVLDV